MRLTRANETRSRRSETRGEYSPLSPSPLLVKLDYFVRGKDEGRALLSYRFRDRANVTNGVDRPPDFSIHPCIRFEFVSFRVVFDACLGGGVRDPEEQRAVQMKRKVLSPIFVNLNRTSLAPLDFSTISSSSVSSLPPRGKLPWGTFTHAWQTSEENFALYLGPSRDYAWRTTGGRNNCFRAYARIRSPLPRPTNHACDTRSDVEQKIGHPF